MTCAYYIDQIKERRLRFRSKGNIRYVGDREVI